MIARLVTRMAVITLIVVIILSYFAITRARAPERITLVLTPIVEPAGLTPVPQPTFAGTIPDIKPTSAPTDPIYPEKENVLYLPFLIM